VQPEPSAASLEERAYEYARRGDFGVDAREVNETLTRLAPANQGAWTRLARCCLELGQLDEASAALDAALQLNPQNTIARNLQIEVGRRRVGPEPPPAARRPRGAGASRPARRDVGTSPSSRSRRAATPALAGLGRAEFAALGHLAPPAAVEALTARIEPLLMALNDRPFAQRVVDARNRAGQAGAWLFRRGSLRPLGPGRIHVYQQGGRFEPQLEICLVAASTWARDALGSGLAFQLAADGDDERADNGRERAARFFEVFQRQIASTWRVHLTDWLRANGGVIQHGDNPPAVDLLPHDAVAWLVNAPSLAGLDRVFCGRWLFADRAEDMGTLTDAPRLLRWIEQTFTDLLPLWSTVYREGNLGDR
jgi:tetratricopeptide (TPR) repeat protein